MKTIFTALIMLFLVATSANAEWLVTWEVCTTYTVSCPQPESIPDEFGRVQENSIQYNLLACFHTSIVVRSKIFDTKSEAEEFYNRAKNKECREYALAYTSCLQNIKIAEITDKQP